ncbi:MAG: dihydrofolate reductase family protein [Clostridia bacterium]
MLDFFTMPFPREPIKLKLLMKMEEKLAEIKACSPDQATLAKVKEIYGEVFFPPAPADRPYTIASIIESVDGKIAFMDDQQGPLIASKNLQDPDGGFADFWILNMLRAYADGVIIGAKTMQMEKNMACNCYDAELADARIAKMGKKTYCPTHIIVSFDGTDIPFEHQIFKLNTQIIIGTSTAGQAFTKTLLEREVLELGPFASINEVNMDQIKIDIAENPGKIIVIATGENGKTDGKVLLYILRKIGIERLMIESPSYMTYLMGIDAMDEMFINYSTVFAGGSVGFGAFQHFTTEKHPHSDFLQINLHKNNFIYTRQKLVYGLNASEER